MLVKRWLEFHAGIVSINIAHEQLHKRKKNEARSVAQLALKIEPGFTAASKLLKQLGKPRWLILNEK